MELICKCGHLQSRHDADPRIVGCTIRSDYRSVMLCYCVNFKPDNLKYLESKYAEKNYK